MEHEHTLFLSSSNCIHRRCASLSCVRSIDLPWSRMHVCGWMDVCIPRYTGRKEAFIVWNSAELQNCTTYRYWWPFWSIPYPIYLCFEKDVRCTHVYTGSIPGIYYTTPYMLSLSRCIEIPFYFSFPSYAAAVRRQ